MSDQATKQLARMKRLRVMITVVTLICIGVSVTLNVMHAPANPMAQGVAGLPPVAAFFVIELIARIPSSNWLLSLGRIVGALAVGGIAGWISYVSQIDYVLSLGFSAGQAYVFPAVIDGTMAVSTLSLVEVVRKVRQLEDEGDEARTAAGDGGGVASEPETAKQVAETEVKASDAAAPGLPAAPVSPAPAGTASVVASTGEVADGSQNQPVSPAPPARRPGRPRIPVERDVDGEIVDKTTKQPVSPRTAQRVRRQQPERLDD